MKRTIAWALLFLFLLGATPALASAPMRDVTDWDRGGATQAASDAVTVQSDSDQPEDDGSTGAAYAPSQSIVSVSGRTAAAPASGNNNAPVAENQQIETYRGVSVGGQLTAHDPDGDTLTFEIVLLQPPRTPYNTDAYRFFHTISALGIRALPKRLSE